MLLKREWIAITLFLSILCTCIAIAYLTHDVADPTIARAIDQK